MLERSAVVEHAEVLPPEPSSAARARRLIEATLGSHVASDVLDTATLLVSEVVANAVLHGGGPVGFRCLLRADRRIRVEVGDGSVIIPTARNYALDAETGRGLHLVEMLSAAWGVDTTTTGKVVWFEIANDPPVEQVDERAVVTVPDDVSTPAEVQLIGAPVQLLKLAIQQGDALLRHRALAWLANAPEEGKRWQPPQLDVGPVLAVLDEADARGDARTDAVVWLAAGSDRGAAARVALIDEADALARDDALPIDPSLPEVAACRSWLHGEIVGQLRGARPTPWSLPDALEPVQQPATIDSDALVALRAMRIGVIVVDDANRITFVNDAAAELLGWRAEDLAHRRLTAIIPPETREAHLAGFSRYTLTGEARILGRTIHVQALCRDGARIDVDLRIDALPKVHGRRSFMAEISSRP